MLAEALKVHTALRTLSLDENRIGAEGACVLQSLRLQLDSLCRRPPARQHEMRVSRACVPRARGVAAHARTRVGFSGDAEEREGLRLGLGIAALRAVAA
jgi:hypothetical protein